MQASLGELIQHVKEKVVDASEVREETTEVLKATRELTLEEEQALFDQDMMEANRLREDAKYSRSTWVQDAKENEIGVDFTQEWRAVAADLNQIVEEKERQALERNHNPWDPSRLVAQVPSSRCTTPGANSVWSSSNQDTDVWS